MPGAAVAIGLNGPRISAGASGFMSNRSSWLGAPRLKIMMHRLFVVLIGHVALGLGRHQLRQRQADGPQRADLQKIAARHAVAGMSRTLADQIQHAD